MALMYVKELEKKKEEVRKIVLKGLEEAERGESVSYETVEAEMKERYGI